MSLSEALQELLDARGWRPAELITRVSGTRNRATFYRLLAGETPEPRLTSLVKLCNVLAVSPSELLRLAGMLEDQRHPPALVQVELRQAFGELQDLNDEDRQLCLALMHALIETRAEQQGHRAQRPESAT